VERNSGLNVQGSILDFSIQWDSIGLTVIQTLVVYWFVLVGLKLVGRRVFGVLGPQEIVVIVLIAESQSSALNLQNGGFWDSIAAVERIPILNHWVEGPPKKLYTDSHGTNQTVMSRYSVSEEDLNKVVREYGVPDLQAFECLTLESDGTITGILKPEFTRTRSVGDPTDHIG
jgi:uncharacterized membrane protein YcaP (DUF421 family)